MGRRKKLGVYEKEEIDKRFDTLFSSATTTDIIPPNRGSSNPYIKKIIDFLKPFEVGEIKEIKCNNEHEQKYTLSKLRYYSKYLVPRVYHIIGRMDWDSNLFIYVQRKENAD